MSIQRSGTVQSIHPDSEWPTESEPPCPHRFTDWEAPECWSGNCYQATAELLEAIRPHDEPVAEPHPERQRPNGYEIVNLWHLVLHWVR